MDLKIVFITLSAVIGVVSYFPYLRDIFSLKTRPHAFTWLIGILINGTAAAVILSGHGGLGAISLGLAMLCNALVLFFSLKHGTRDITRSDTIILIVCLLAIVLWWQLDNALIALFTITAIRALSYIPTLRKTLKDPQSETVITWIGFTIANVFTILSLSEYNVLTLTFLVTISLFNLAVISICLIGNIKNPLRVSQYGLADRLF